MRLTKQIVYLPVKVEDELPAENVLCIAEEFNGIAAGKLEVNPRGIISCDTDTIGCTVNYISHWLKEQQAFVFTPEQLNEYTANVVRQALETAAEKAEIKEDTLDTESYKKADEFAEGKSYSYVTDTDGCLVGVDTFEVNKQSITNTFEETYKKFEV